MQPLYNPYVYYECALKFKFTNTKYYKMKYRLINLSCFLLICVTGLNAQSWWGNGVKGEGPIISRDIDLDAFDGFELGISGNVILKKGNTQSVKVEGQANIIDLLKTKVKNKKWYIGFEENVNKHKSLTIHITIPELTEVHLSGSGNITGEDYFSVKGQLDVSVSGSGNIKLDASSENSNCNISGSGNIKLSGKTAKNNISITGSGNLTAYDLRTLESDISITGSGDCKINVQNNLVARITGSGNIYYKGNPKVRSKVVGSGDVESVD